MLKLGDGTCRTCGILQTFRHNDPRQWNIEYQSDVERFLNICYLRYWPTFVFSSHTHFAIIHRHNIHANFYVIWHRYSYSPHLVIISYFSYFAISFKFYMEQMLMLMLTCLTSTIQYKVCVIAVTIKASLVARATSTSVSIWMDDRQGRPNTVNLSPFVDVDLSLWLTVYIAVILLIVKTYFPKKALYMSLEAFLSKTGEQDFLTQLKCAETG